MGARWELEYGGCARRGQRTLGSTPGGVTNLRPERVGGSGHVLHVLLRSEEEGSLDEWAAGVRLKHEELCQASGSHGNAGACTR